MLVWIFLLLSLKDKRNHPLLMFSLAISILTNSIRVAAYFEFEYKPNLRTSRPEQHLGLSTKFSYEEPVQFELG